MEKICFLQHCRKKKKKNTIFCRQLFIIETHFFHMCKKKNLTSKFIHLIFRISEDFKYLSLYVKPI